jgi:hypothetical protein
MSSKRYAEEFKMEAVKQINVFSQNIIVNHNGQSAVIDVEWILNSNIELGCSFSVRYC